MRSNMSRTVAAFSAGGGSADIGTFIRDFAPTACGRGCGSREAALADAPGDLLRVDDAGEEEADQANDDRSPEGGPEAIDVEPDAVELPGDPGGEREQCRVDQDEEEAEGEDKGSQRAEDHERFEVGIEQAEDEGDGEGAS